MKFRTASVSLALFLAVMAGASFTRCGSDGGLGIDLGTAPIDSGDIASSIAGSCDTAGSALDCDGDLTDEAGGANEPLAVKGDCEGFCDFDAIEDLILNIGGSADSISRDTILNALAAEGLLPEIDNEDGVPLSVTGTSQSDCDNEGGTITVTKTYVNVYTLMDPPTPVAKGDVTYTLLPNGDEIETDVISLANCLVEDDLINADGQSLRISGSITTVSRYLNQDAEPTTDDVDDERVTGGLTITGLDIDTSDATASDPFWVGAAPIAANAWVDWEAEETNGGLCIGAGIAFGAEADDDADDDCADDADDAGEVFLEAVCDIFEC